MAKLGRCSAATGCKAAEQSRLNLEENGNYLATFGVDSTQGEIQLSGSSDLVYGEAKIYFDYSFSSIISDTVSIKVLVTPTTNLQGQLYAAEKTKYGFVVKLLNGTGNGKFDWLVIARCRGYEGNDALHGHHVQHDAHVRLPGVSELPTPSPESIQ